MKIVANLVKIVIVLLVIGNIGFSYILLQSIAGLEDAVGELKVKVNYPASLPVTAANSQGNVDLSVYATKDYVDEAVSGVSAPEGGSTTTVTQTVAETPKTSIIPINATYETQSLDWIDVPNSDFYLDLATDYAEDAVVTWDAFIHELHGNGRVEARLFDATHGIVVVNSEVATNNSSSTLVTSGNVAIWKGKNLYRVQIKSEKGFPVYFNSGRLKIRY